MSNNKYKLCSACTESAQTSFPVLCEICKKKTMEERNRFIKIKLC